MNRTNFIFPELETDRLRLAVLTLDDAAAVFEHFSDENVTRFMDIEPCRTIEEANEVIQFHIDDTGTRWGIFNKADGQLIGTCGFHCWVQGEKSRAEIGFDLAVAHWGRGFMREALQPVLAFGFNRMGLDLIEATVEQGNERSIGLLKRFQFEREIELRDGLIYYCLHREGWR
ncbi:ribosomal-protein-alanine N-acetyltransferase [Paenibacillus taihuensis]|uniref:Ribosomal-protein-alanine N-acetyltransferase n=1 Tax=Paenibacillus taihuensis TaxID=1156355 RepID=A0A3D9RV68_9BACL|nr:GNAT family N-acetyltransferase [Paenibacillus taihuensis]REE83880.1 ribosomal-protein-alanine N-acetyltransferase [Paenibacillus taihuensis]